jgi:glycosyltransferase involved in cell wall biosynthesis
MDVSSLFRKPPVPEPEPDVAACYALARLSDTGSGAQRRAARHSCLLAGELPDSEVVSNRSNLARPPHKGLVRQHRSAGDSAIELLAYTDATVIGGAEHCLATIIGQLGSRFRVTVAGASAEVLEYVAEARPGTRRIVVPSVPGTWSPTTLLAHLRLFRGLGADVCHLNLRSPYTCEYAVVAALLTPGLRVVAVEHLPLHSSSRRGRWLKRQTSRRVDAHIAVGASAAREVERDAGLPLGSISVIRNGVPGNAPGKAEALANGTVIGSVGRLVSQKGYDVLVDALPLLPGVTAVVAGDGPLRETLEARARAKGVAGRFVVTGWMSTPAPLLRACDLFVLPSRFEGLPLAVLEAMEAQLAVVATDVGSTSEAVRDGETGLLVPPDDPARLAAAIRRLLDDEELRNRMAVRGREVWQAQFDALRMGAEYERLYTMLAT